MLFARFPATHLVFCGILCLVGIHPPADASDLASRARALHQELFVFDAHCDTAMRLLDDKLDLGKRSKDGHMDIPRMVEGGLNAQVFALWPQPDYWPDRATHRTLQMLDAVQNALSTYPNQIELAKTAADAKRISNQGKIAIFLGIEGGHAIEDDLAMLRIFHQLGVRVVTLTWARHTNWADSSSRKPLHGGLTELGKQVVREMDRLGMIIDLSHASDDTFFQVLKITKNPVIASHSNSRAVCNHHRNLSDNMLKALAANGGVVGMNYYLEFVDRQASRKLSAAWDKIMPKLAKLKEMHLKNPDRYHKLKDELMREHTQGIPKVPVGHLVDHIDHIVKVAGIDHVGLGSDYDGCSEVPQGLEDISKISSITAELLKRGYKQGDIEKILGGNFFRVFEQVLDK